MSNKRQRIYQLVRKIEYGIPKDPRVFIHQYRLDVDIGYDTYFIVFSDGNDTITLIGLDEDDQGIVFASLIDLEEKQWRLMEVRGKIRKSNERARVLYKKINDDGN